MSSVDSISSAVCRDVGFMPCHGDIEFSVALLRVSGRRMIDDLTW